MPTQATVLALAVDPRNPARIFAATYDTTGAYITADGARSWRVFNAGLARAPILAMLYAGDSLLAGTTAGLYRLVDQTWTRIDAIPAVAIYSIARDARAQFTLQPTRTALLRCSSAPRTAACASAAVYLLRSRGGKIKIIDLCAQT